MLKTTALSLVTAIAEIAGCYLGYLWVMDRARAWVLFLTLDFWGLHPDIRPLVGTYLRIMAFGALPLLLYAAFRRYLQGMHVVRPIMLALLSAHFVNAGAYWVLIYGDFGLRALGVGGAGWATTIGRVDRAACAR